MKRFFTNNNNSCPAMTITNVQNFPLCFVVKEMCNLIKNNSQNCIRILHVIHSTNSVYILFKKTIPSIYKSQYLQVVLWGISPSLIQLTSITELKEQLQRERKGCGIMGWCHMRSTVTLEDTKLY